MIKLFAKMIVLSCLASVVLGLAGCANMKYPPYSSVHRDVSSSYD